MTTSYMPQFEDLPENDQYIPGAGILGRRWSTTHEVIHAISEGLPPVTYRRLNRHYKLNDPPLIKVVKIGKRTLHTRLTSSKSFTNFESERIYRFARILELAATLFDGDTNEAAKWLVKPAPAFNGKAPIHLATSEVGAREVENLILSMREGVFV